VKLVVEAVARDDLRAIDEQGQRLFGRRQAARYNRELMDAMARLADYPLIYPERREFDPPLRVCPHKAHVILYRLADETVTILPVRHGREDWLEV